MAAGHDCPVAGLRFSRLPLPGQPRTPGRLPGERTAEIGLALALAAVILQTALHLANAAFLGHRRLLDANSEASVFTWASTAAAASAGFAAILCATTVGRRAGGFVVAGFLMLFLSLDDALAIHEEIGAAAARSLGLARSYDSVLWPALYAPLLLVLLALLVRAGVTSRGLARRLLLSASALLVLAVAAEIVSAPVSGPGSLESWPHVIEGAFEEGAELAAWILIAFALAARVVASARAPAE